MLKSIASCFLRRLPRTKTSTETTFDDQQIVPQFACYIANCIVDSSGSGARRRVLHKAGKELHLLPRRLLRLRRALPAEDLERGTRGFGPRERSDRHCSHISAGYAVSSL